jgi:peptide/nickel transport system permease protein
VIVVMCLAAAFAPWVAPHDPFELNYVSILASPSWEHPFGTDNFGRDVFSRVIFGARTALAIGFLSSLGGCTIGALIGVVSAYFGGWIDNIIQRLMDVLMSCPRPGGHGRTSRRRSPPPSARWAARSS